MRWHDFGSGREASRSQYREYGQGERQGGAVTRLPQARLRERRPSPRLRKLRHPQPPSPPQSCARREPGATGQNSCQPEGLRLKSAARRSVEQGPACGMRPRRRAQGPRMRTACYGPLRGRIQAHTAWNLLRPARATLSADLTIFAIWPASSFALSPIFARNAHVFH